ncbi:MAG: NUDIX domain-containing protein [Polyangiales bacterium]
MIDALVMAGGRGERMRATHGPTAKPLVRVLGLELIERNLAMLLRLGYRGVAVSVPAGEPSLAAWVRGRGAELARAAAARVEVLEEATPLGTIGVASRLRGSGDVVVVNADNLVTLDLPALAAHHRAVNAAFTVATHLQPFRIPFGEVVAEGGLLRAYREKPELPVRVSSGTYVLGPAAAEALEYEARCDVPTLVERLLARGLAVGAFAHESPWIDVNDAPALARAEALVAAHPDRFERHATEPSPAVAGVVVRDPGGAVLLERRPDTARAYAGVWDTPGGKLEADEAPEDAAARELDEELGLRAPLRAVATFDDLDPTSGRVYRHHVFVAEAAREAAQAREGQTLRWFTPEELAREDALATPARRALAWCSRRG